MNNTVFRNEKCVTDENVLKYFRQEIEKRESYINCIEDLVDIYAKNPSDHFIVTDKPLNIEVVQGDVLIWSKDCGSYKRFIEDTEITTEIPENYNLQGATSVTGDHRVVPMPNSNFKITIAKISVDVGFNQKYIHEGRYILSDKPFLVTHREHGNVALPAGEYLACVALNPTNMRAPESVMKNMLDKEKKELEKYNAREKVKWEQKIKENEQRHKDAAKFANSFKQINWSMID